jgi:protein-L-isoaspartate(D-aspartate) O-methyltransferase
VETIEACRDFYARLVMGAAGRSNERLLAAFATVERERYLGKGPWSVFTGDSYIATVSDDPRVLYQDVLVGIAPERGINNGKPSLHALCIAAAAPREGEEVVHVGAGSGYYTAILAQMVGASGKVTGFEIEADLAERARANLASAANVRIVCASAAQGVLPASDLVYVSAGATHPLAVWLDALKIGGRLVFPMTPDHGLGLMLIVSRLGATAYAASFLCFVVFISCIGARSKAASKALSEAIETRSPRSIRSLRRGESPDASAWCVGDGWWLSSADPPAAGPW